MYELIVKSLRSVPPKLRLKLLVLQFLMVLSAIIELLGVVSIGPFIALAINPDYVHDSAYLYKVYIFVGSPSEKMFLIYSGVVFSLLFVVSNGLLLIMQVKMIRLSNLLEANLSVSLYRYYISKEYLFHVKNKSSTLISKVSSDVARFCNGIVLSFLQINSRVFSIVILLVLLIVVNAYAAMLIGVALASVYVVVYLFVNKRLKENGKAQTRVNRERVHILHESFDGIKCIEFLGMHGRYIDTLTNIFKRNVYLKVSNKVLKDLPFFIIESIAFVLIVAVIIALFGSAASVEGALADLAVICLAGYRLIPKFQQVYRALATVKSNHSILDEIYKDVRESQQLSSLAAARYDFFCGSGRFELKDISYSYGSVDIFSGVNFYLEPGEVIGLTGVSGTGKSTLMSIMTAMFEPGRGEVTFAGQSINKGTADAWRRKVGYVDSETYIFDVSLKENITLQVEVSDEYWLDEVIELACLEGVVSGLSQGVESLIGSKGAKLSSGQLQRIGFARALYRKPCVMFLDEATNALDFDTQKNLIAKIRVKFPDLAIVLISHRLDIRDTFDRCYLLSQNQLLEI